MTSNPTSLSIQMYGLHNLRPFREASIRIVNEHGVGVLAATVRGDGETIGYFPCDPAPQCGGRPTADHELSDAYDLIVEVRLDDHDPVAALVVAPHMSTVVNRKIVPRLANTELGAVAVAFVVSPADEAGYRARLTALMELVDPDNLGAIDDIISAMDEPSAFSFAWREYGNASVSLPFAERAQNLAARYEGLDDAVAEFIERLDTAEPETVLALFVEEVQLKHAVLETEDQMPAQRVAAMIRKFDLDEAEVQAGLDDAEDREEFIAELRDAFGLEPRLNDPVHAVTTRIAMPEPPGAAAAAAADDDASPQSPLQDDAAADEKDGEDGAAAAASDAPAGSGDGDREAVDAAEERGSGDEAQDADAAAESEKNGDEDATENDGADPTTGVDEGEMAENGSDAVEEGEPAPAGPRDVVGDALGDLDPAPPAQEQQHVDPVAASGEADVGDQPATEGEVATEAVTTATVIAPCTECDDNRRAMVGLGRERDALEATICEMRTDNAAFRDAAEADVTAKAARIAELDEAIEGYRCRCDALEEKSAADTARIAELEGALAGATAHVEELVKSTARLVNARNDPGPGQRMRLTVKVGSAELMIPAQSNIAIGDLRRAVLQRAVRLGTLTQHEADARNLQLFLGSTVLFDDDTLDEMGIDGTAAGGTETLTLEENGAVSIASPVGSPTHPQYQMPQPALSSPPAAASPGSATTATDSVAAPPPPHRVDPRELVIHLDEDTARELGSHEMLDRRLMMERERIETEDLQRNERRAFDAAVKRVLDLARMKLVDRAAYSRTEEHRSQARAAISRIDSAVRVGMTPEAMLGVARHAELTAGALDVRGSEERRTGQVGVLTSQEMDMELPSEMQQRIERRRTQCVSDLKEMIETLQSRVAIRPDRLGEAEALLSKARSYVSLARSLSVEELQTCLRETMTFVSSCRK